jgi:hypothetical protein
MAIVAEIGDVYSINKISSLQNLLYTDLPCCRLSQYLGAVGLSQLENFILNLEWMLLWWHAVCVHKLSG